MSALPCTLKPIPRTAYASTRKQDSAATGRDPVRAVHVGAFKRCAGHRGERLAAPSHHASRAAAWRVLLPGGCAVVPPGQDHGQPAETGDGIGAGEFGDLSGFTQPYVPWLCAVSRCLGSVSRIALGSGWGVGVHPLYEPLADRRGGACA